MLKRIPLSEDTISMWLQSGAILYGGKNCPLQVDKKGDNYSFVCNSNELNVSAVLSKAGQSHWELDVLIKNETEQAIDLKFSYPYVLYVMDDDDVRVFDPTFGGVMDRIRWATCNTYPGRASFCMNASASANQAVAAGLYNKEQLITTLRNCSGGREGHMRITLEKLTIKAHSSLQLPTMFICFGDNWAKAFEPYRAYIHRTFVKQNPKPLWMDNERFTQSRAGHCLSPFNPPEKAAGIWMFSERNTVRTYESVKDEIDKAIQKGEQEGYRPLFYQFGWWENLTRLQGLYMFDSLCGDYTAAHETAKRIVDYIHQRGFRTYLYTNAIAAGDETDVFLNHPELFVHNQDGLPVYNDLLPMYLFCPSAPEIRDYWDEVLKYILIDMDADGVFLDQICGATPPALCYDTSHNHPNTYSYGADIVELIAYIRTKAKTLKPDCCVMGELVLDSRSVYLDESHGYGYSSIWSTPPEDRELLVNRVPSEYYIFTRYLCPYIYTQIGSSKDDLINGAAGSYADDLWREYQQVFESGVYPCKCEPAGAVAYLFGGENETHILAVKSDGDIGQVTVTLPDGKRMEVTAEKKPQYIVVGE